MNRFEGAIIANEYDEARLSMLAAVARFERASRAYRALPLSFDYVAPEDEGTFAWAARESARGAGVESVR